MYYNRHTVDLSEMVGLVMKDVEQSNSSDDGDYIKFTSTDNRVFLMYHYQDCCESVSIEDICGDLKDLIGSEILEAYEETNHGDENGESCTWTFYTIATIKGTVNIRWYGSSNGYYSERVDFMEVTGDE